MKMKHLLALAILLATNVPAAYARNLREAKVTKEYRVFDSKAGKRDGDARPLDAKAGKAATPTRIIRSCGALWHRSLSPLNPNSCTNDDKRVPEDPSKLYLTVEDCCKAEFGKVHGCNVYNVCQPTTKPSPVPTRRDPVCGVYWHRSLSHFNPDSCTDDGNLPSDPSRVYATVEECCKTEFGKIAGCNVFRASCDRPTETHAPAASEFKPPTTSQRTSNPTLLTPDVGDDGKAPTSRPTVTRTLGPTPLVPTVAEPDSPPPSLLLRKSLAERLNEFYESGNATQNRDELRDILGTSDIELIDMDVATDDLVTAMTISTETEQQPTDATELLESLLDQTESKCKCVNCEEDSVCGGLWKGIGHYDKKTTDPDLQVHIVVSHCKSPLDWLQEFTEGIATESIHIITKCGSPVLGAPDFSTIIELPNVGRCDHTYAWYIANLLPDLVPDDQDNSVVVFLKDDISNGNMHQLGEWSELRHLTHLASTEQGFACGINSMNVHFSQSLFSLSAFHETNTLAGFAMDTYQRNLKGYALDSTEFKSEYSSLGSWWKSLGIEPAGDLTQVCYGGVFAASPSNIRKQTQEFWRALELNLSRGNNIQEGHYAERSWSMLMSTPLESYQTKALIEHSDGVYINTNSMHGALMQLPKLFLHVGAKATSSSEVLSESLIKHLPELSSDDYRVAVHGKYGVINDASPNVDRLASCMWSDQIKNSFPDYMRAATICPDNLLHNLSDFMAKAVMDHKDIVILNPWLSRRGAANSLALFLNPVWSVHTIIYYRRYYEWITLVHEEWASDILEHASNLELVPFSSFRYIDFIREYNKRLFYGKDVMEDGYPIRPFGGIQNDTAPMNDGISQHYDPASNSRLEDLTDLTDYTYFVAHEYSSNQRFRRHLTIVNYHDAQSIETNFFCHVLHDAHNACRAAVAEELETHGQATTKTFVQTDTEFPIRLLNGIKDIVVNAVRAGRLQPDESLPSVDVPLQLRLWVQQVYNAFELSGMSVSDLPIECLYNFEVKRLLEVSLAYEKSLLPAFYDSLNGAANLVQEFKTWQFCSVDAEKVLNDSQWNFLFESTTTLSSRANNNEPV